MNYMSRIAQDRRVKYVEAYYEAFASWTKPDGGSELCLCIGCSMNLDSLGAVKELTPEMRILLTQPGSVVVDQAELERLGVKGVGDKAEINKQTVQIVGLIKGFKSLAGPYVYCSRETARNLLRIVMPTDHTTFFLVQCHHKEDAQRVVDELQRQYADDLSAFTTAEFSLHSRLHWLFKTKAGIAIGYAAILGLLVGMVVTSQTLYAATTASAREFAILLALGIPRWRISLTVVTQSFWIGIIGALLAYPTVQALAALAALGGVNVILPWWLLAGAGAVTVFMALISGLMALRSVRQIEPMTLLR
jgi:putative ABC transport system permease protein